MPRRRKVVRCRLMVIGGRPWRNSTAYPAQPWDCRRWLATRGHPLDMTCQAAQPWAESAVWKLAQLPGSAHQAPLGLNITEGNRGYLTYLK